MPSMPPKACGRPMCNAFQSPSGRGYCSTHQPHRPKPSVAKRKSDAFYNKVRWRNYRRSHLMLNPLCTRCMSFGFVEEGVHVDHIIPRSAGGDDYPAANGVRSLCVRCHSSVTAEYLKDPEKFIEEVCLTYGLTKPR